MSSKDESCLSRELQPLPSDWGSIFKFQDHPTDRESVKCARIPILEAHQWFLDQVEHLEAHILLEIEVGLHAGSDLRM